MKVSSAYLIEPEEHTSAGRFDPARGIHVPARTFHFVVRRRRDRSFVIRTETLAEARHYVARALEPGVAR